jgi:hypothetical protein
MSPQNFSRVDKELVQSRERLTRELAQRAGYVKGFYGRGSMRSAWS